MKTITKLTIAVAILSLWLGLGISFLLKENRNQKVDLPEEYKLIDSTQNLRGWFDKEGVLHIEFNNR